MRGAISPLPHTSSRAWSLSTGTISPYKVKVKVKVEVVFLTEHHALEAYWGVEAYLRAFLISALDGSGQLHVPFDLSPGKELLLPTG
jgi:hypothetical protein